jgi:predicted ATPase/DNA-binding SARP family transcriptional activator
VRVRIAVLGPVEAHDEAGRAVALGGARLRGLLAMLALAGGRPVGADRLVAGLWGDEPPAGAVNALQSLVSRLRRALGDPAAVTSVPAGYQLAGADVDADRFAGYCAEGRRCRAAGDTDGAVEAFGAALALWCGPALADLTAPFAAGAAARLDAERLDAVAELADAHLSAGAPAAAVDLLAEPLADHPLSERLATLSVRALHAAGRQADALACYERTRRALADELGVDPSGELAAAHLGVLRGTPAEPPAPPTRRTNLRAALSSFIGRDREVREIRKLLADCRLVTLVGPGGTGKTRLAIEAAAGLVDATPDGVWLVELAPVGDPGAVPNAVLTALNTPTIVTTGTTGKTATVPDRAEQLRAALDGRQALLILDNCEHLVDAVARLADDLLASCPGVRILATSRAALSLPGEKLYPVPPLELPAEGADLAAAAASSAIRLLADRATAVRPGFRVDETNLADIAAICRRLDGAPLALELAAARLRALTPAQLADRLDDRFRLLTGGSRAALPRHQTLRAVVSWSWDLLDADERAVARRLSVFPGAITLEAAETVCAGGVGSVLEAVAGLVDQSLLEADDRRVTRYRMLDTIRAYSAEQLDAAGETDAVRRAHLRYYVELAEANEPLLRTREQDGAMDRFSAEHDNLLAALRYAIDAHDAPAALRLGAALVWYWVLVGYVMDAAHWLAEVMSVAPDEAPDGLASQYALCHIGAAISDMPRLMGDADAMVPAVARMERLIADAIAAGDVHPLVRMAALFPYIVDNRHEDGERYLETLIALDDPWVRASGLAIRGNLRSDVLQRPEEAGQDAKAAVELYRSIGERWGLSMALVQYGEHLAMTGDMAAAADTLADAWREASTFIPETERAGFLIRLAGIRVRAGDVDTAERDLALADELRAASPRRHDFEWFQADLVAGEVHRRRGRYGAARERLRRVVAGLDEAAVGRPQVAAIACAGLALVEYGAGDLDAADAAVRDGLRALAPSRDLPVLVMLAQALAAIAAARGDHRRLAVLHGMVEAQQRHPPQYEVDLSAGLAAARAALGADGFAAATRRGGELGFVDVYDFLGVDAAEPGPMAHAHRRPSGR